MVSGGCGDWFGVGCSGEEFSVEETDLELGEKIVWLTDKV